MLQAYREHFTIKQQQQVHRPAVMRPLRLDAAALRALVDNLTRLQLQALHVLLGGVAFRNCPLSQWKRKADSYKEILGVTG